MHYSQIDVFVLHHKEVKEAFDLSDKLGLNDIDDRSEAFTQILSKIPLLEEVVRLNGGVLMDKRTRLRTYFALSQLDGLIEDGELEQKVRGSRRENLVRRIN